MARSPAGQWGPLQSASEESYRAGIRLKDTLLLNLVSTLLITELYTSTVWGLTRLLNPSIVYTTPLHYLQGIKATLTA